MQGDVVALDAALALRADDRGVVVDDCQVDVGERVAEPERAAAAEVGPQRRAERFEVVQGTVGERELGGPEALGDVLGQRSVLAP